MALPAASRTAPSSRLLVTEEPSSRSQGCCRGTRGHQGPATQRGVTPPKKTCVREKRGWRDLRRPGSGLPCRSGGGWRSRAGASGCGCGRWRTRSGSHRTRRGCRLRGARRAGGRLSANTGPGGAPGLPSSPPCSPPPRGKGWCQALTPNLSPVRGPGHVARPPAAPLTHAEREGAERRPQHGAGAPRADVAAALHEVLLRHPPRHAQHDVEEEGELGTEGTPRVQPRCKHGTHGCPVTPEGVTWMGGAPESSPM